MALLIPVKRPDRRLIVKETLAPEQNTTVSETVERVAWRHEEAPDRGLGPIEAPEMRLTRGAEAPDAGYRRSTRWDSSSVRGRSFS